MVRKLKYHIGKILYGFISYYTTLEKAEQNLTKIEQNTVINEWLYGTKGGEQDG